MSERTKYEAVLDVRYHIRLAFLHERFYKRVSSALAFISLCASSAAFINIARPSPAALRVIAFVVAFAGFCSLLGGFAIRAAKHKFWREKMAEILASSHTMSLQEIDIALAQHDARVDDEVEALRVIAVNDNLRSNGHEAGCPETFAQRFIWRPLA